MSWRYEIIRTHVRGETLFSVHEVYRNGERITGWSEQPESLTSESVDGLRWMLDRVRERIDSGEMYEERDGALVRIDTAPTRAEERG